MSVARTFVSIARRAPIRASAFQARTFATVAPRFADNTPATRKPTKWDPKPGEPQGKLLSFDEVKGPEDLLPPGAEPGTVPTDLEQATGLERLEILGKMQGIDIFDMRPLPSDRVGTFDDPIIVRSAGEEIQAGCTGCPADSHIVSWCLLTRDRPYERCIECGSVYKMEYVGVVEDEHDHGHGHGHGHGHHHPAPEEPKSMADFVKQDYWYR